MLETAARIIHDDVYLGCIAHQSALSVPVYDSKASDNNTERCSRETEDGTDVKGLRSHLY